MTRPYSEMVVKEMVEMVQELGAPAVVSLALVLRNHARS
jgi:hypothetical protein